MNLHDKIIQILDSEDSDQQILELESPWSETRDILFSILLDNSKMSHWYDVCAFIYSSASEKEYPVDYTIALLLLYQAERQVF